MWSPNPKVWSPEIENVESKNLPSRSVMMTIDASPTFRSKGHGRRHYSNWRGHCPPLIRSGRDNGDKKIQFISLFLNTNQVLVYMFDSLASFCVSMTATSLLVVQMPLNNRPTSSRVWKPAKWKLSEMFGACERLALAADC